jgi:hypothetical protein
MHTSRHFDVKLASECFDVKLVICSTFPDKPGEGLTHGPHYTGIKSRMYENMDSKSTYNESITALLWLQM